MMNIARIVPSFLVAAALFGCDSGDRWESGKYRVYWIDASANLNLGYDLGNGGGIIQRVEFQVISIGEDARWIVAARHPEGDKTKTEYFYFSKPDDGPYKNMNEIVQGPFTESEFRQKSKDLNLPFLSKHF